MPATDSFSSFGKGYTTPATDGAQVTPDDSNDLGYVTRAVYIGGAGDVHVTLKYGAEITLRGVGAGTVLPIRVSRVWASNTTATDLVALW